MTCETGFTLLLTLFVCICWFLAMTNPPNPPYSF